jgi:ArsR family transcriptional regulator
MRRMPKLSLPQGMTEEVAAIIEVLGNHVRTEMLRRLAQQPMTAVDLAAELDVAHSSVWRHLVLLEERGLVIADADPGRRRGNKHVVWATVPDRVREMGTQWIEYASGY